MLSHLSMRILVLIVTLANALPQPQQVPSSSSSPDILTNSDMFVEPNGTLQLKCQLNPSITADNNALYQWRFIPTESAAGSSPSVSRRDQSLATLGPSGEWKAYDDLITTGQRLGGEFNLDIARVGYAQNDGDYYCEINMPGGRVYQSARFHVYVKYAPQPPTIQYSSSNRDPLDSSSLSLREGESLNISCSTEGGNPPPQVTWLNPDADDEILYTNATMRNGQSSALLIIRTLDKRHHGRQYKCQIKNAAVVQPLEIQTQPLDVKYKPRVTVAGYIIGHSGSGGGGGHRSSQQQYDVAVLGPFNPLEIERDTAIRLSCIVDANPPITTNPWWRRDTNVILKDSYNLTYNSSNNREMSNGSPIECVAENAIGESSAALAINIFSGPQVDVTPRLSTVKEGESNTFDCSVNANPPVPPDAIEWYKGERQVGIGRHLVLTDIHRLQAGEYKCRARNRFQTSASGGADQFITREASAASRLVVQYRPGTASIQQIINADNNNVAVAAGDSAVVAVIAAQVGESLSLFCSTNDPGVPLATFRWSKRNDPSFFRITGQYLNFTRLTLGHNGEYECMPSNEVGDGAAKTVTVAVNEPARFLLLTNDRKDSVIIQNINSDQQQPLALECAARGKPAPKIEWLRNGRLIHGSNNKFRISNDDAQPVDVYSYSVRSELRFEGDGRKDLFNGAQRLSRADRGIYTCRINPLLERNTTVLIQYAPVLRNRFSKAATTLVTNANTSEKPATPTDTASSEARIPCLVEARPAPTISWLGRNGQAIIPSDSNSNSGRIYAIPPVAIDDETYRSELVIRQPTRDDLGDYVCVARNMIEPAAKHFSIALTERSVPHTPTTLNASQVFYSSLLLRWTAGFDGGYSQQFHVFMLKKPMTPTPTPITPPENNDPKAVKFSSTPNNWLMLTGLDSDAAYSFWVESENQLGTSPGRSNVVHVKTHAAPVESLVVPSPASVDFDPVASLVKYNYTPATPTPPAGSSPPLCANIELLYAQPQQEWSAIAECYLAQPLTSRDDNNVVFDLAATQQQYDTTSGSDAAGLLNLGTVQNVRVRMCLAQAPPTSCSRPTYWRDETLFGASRLGVGGALGKSITVLTVLLCGLAALAVIAALAFFVCRRSTSLQRHFAKKQPPHHHHQSFSNGHLKPSSSKVEATGIDTSAHHHNNKNGGGGITQSFLAKSAEANGIYGHRHSPSPAIQLATAANLPSYNTGSEQNGSINAYGQHSYLQAQVQYPHDVYEAYAAAANAGGVQSAYPIHVSSPPQQQHHIHQANGLPPNPTNNNNGTFYYDDGEADDDVVIMNNNQNVDLSNEQQQQEMQQQQQMFAAGTIVVDENGQELIVDEEGNYHPYISDEGLAASGVDGNGEPYFMAAQLHQQQQAQQHWQQQPSNNNSATVNGGGNLSYFPMNQYHQYNNNGHHHQHQQQHHLNGLPDPYDDDAATFLTHVPSNGHMYQQQQHRSPAASLPIVVLDGGGANATPGTTTTTTTAVKTPSFGEVSDESGYSTSASRGKRIVREIVV